MCRELILKAVEADVSSTSQRAILAILANRANYTTGMTWVSVPTIAIEAPCCVGTARNTLRALVADNHISMREFPGWPSIIVVHPVKDGVRQAAAKLNVASIRAHLQNLARRAPGVIEDVIIWLAEIGLIDLDAKEAKQIALDRARKTMVRKRTRTPANFVGVAAPGIEAKSDNICSTPLQILTSTPTNFEGEPIKEPLNEPLTTLGENSVPLPSEVCKCDSSKTPCSTNCGKQKRKFELNGVAQRKVDPIEEFRAKLTPEELEKAEACKARILASKNRARDCGQASF